MRLTFRTKLVLGSLALICIVQLVTFWALARALTADLLDQLDDRLERQAYAAATWAGEGRHLDRLASRLSGVVSADVAIFNRSGEILGDSAAPHLSYPMPAEPVLPPEIEEAAQGAVGHSSRPKSTTDVTMRYVAVPESEDLIVRLGLGMDQIARTLALMRSRLLWVALGGFVLAGAVALILAQVIARPLRAIARATQKLSTGDYDFVMPALPRDETGSLASTIDLLATQVRTKIAELVEERERLRSLERVRRDFVANVSHELRTPVAAIHGYSETLLRPSLDPHTQKEFLETIHRQSTRMSALVNDLLKLSELEASPQEQGSGVERVPLAELVREVSKAASEAARSGQVSVRNEVSDDVIVQARPDHLEQALQNLVDNAVKYNRPGGDVVVTASRRDDKVHIVVADTGPGIAAEHLPRIFERFYRADQGRARIHGGTGLGLAITKHLVESMGGTISVSSEVGRGSRFTVVMPAGAVE